MTCIQCKEKEPMANDELCTTCSSDNYFREMSFTEESPEIKNCEICGIESKNYATIFWNCLCETCWNIQKDQE